VRDHGDMLDALHLVTKMIGLLILLWVSLHLIREIVTSQG
jgi:hypothetical protein